SRSSALVTLTFSVASDSRLSASNMALISGSRPSRRKCASSPRKRAKSPSAAWSGGRCMPTSCSRLTRGSLRKACVRGSAATPAASASDADQCSRAPCALATSNAARAYGRASVKASLMSDLGSQLVQQRLVRGRVDFTLHDLLGTLDGQHADLLAKLFAGALGHLRDLVLGLRLLAV